MKIRSFIVIVISAVLVFIVSLSVLHPVVVYKVDIPDHYQEAIESQSKGIYSSKLPLVAVYVSVDAIEDDRVYYTIRYFPFGKIAMSYAENDGYNIEKPLTGL